MKLPSRILTIICIALLPFTAIAHGYWLETEGPHKAKKETTVKLYFGDYTAGEKVSGKSLDKMKDIKMSVITPAGEKQSIEMKQQEAYWEGTFTPQTDGTYEITGINDEREVQDWTKHHLGIVRPIQYLKTQYQVGKKATPAQAPLFLDVAIAQTSAKNYEVSIRKNGAPLEAQEVLLAAYGQKERVFNTDVNGKVVFNIDNPAWYVLSTEWIDKTPGEFKQKAYKTVRHRLDVSLGK